MAAAIRYTGLAVAAGGIGVNFRITPLASPMRPLIATQIGKTREAPHPFKSDRPQESHDSAFETGFDIAILLLDPDAFLIEAQNVSDIVGMTGQITGGSHVGQDSPTEHLFFPSQQTLWNFNDLPFI